MAKNFLLRLWRRPASRRSSIGDSPSLQIRKSLFYGLGGVGSLFREWGIGRFDATDGNNWLRANAVMVCYIGING